MQNFSLKSVQIGRILPELCYVHERSLIRAVDIFARVSDSEDDIASITADAEQTDVLLELKHMLNLQIHLLYTMYFSN